jgi:benzoylformate decarboxylase
MDVMEEMTQVGIAEVSTIDRAAVAGSLDRLADELAAIAPGKLAIIAGDEVAASDAAPEAVLLAEAIGAPVYGSSWPACIPFPTCRALWAGKLPPNARAIAETLQAYDAIFALGGKSLITILYTKESAVPPGCAVFQMSADVRDLGRTYPTKLSVMGDIKASLAALLPLLIRRLAGQAPAYAAGEGAHHQPW